ncbi:MAG: zinc ABC transporter substrate-binding protein [Pseudomonadota bacterium]
MLFISCASCNQQPSIVVTLKPIYGLVAALTEGMATPVLLCDGRGSTHTLSLTPGDITTLNGADLVVWVGESYEMVMAKPLIKLMKADQLLTLDEVKGLTFYQQRIGGLFPGQECHCCDHGHDHHHEHDDVTIYDDEQDEEAADTHEHSSIDGHFWLDIENAKICARAIATVLMQKWPVHKEIISANLIKLESSLDALKIELNAQLAPVQGMLALIDHDSLQYVEKQFGFAIKGVLSEEHGMSPSAKHVKKLKDELDANLEEGLIRVFFYEGATDGNAPSLLKNLADAYSIRLAPMDYVGEQLPKGIDGYQVCLRAIAAQIHVGFVQKVVHNENLR